MFLKAKIQDLKHACSRSWVCIKRGMPKVCFIVERHAEELSSADAACLLYMCFRVLSQELQCPCSRVQTAEGHVLLKAGFFFFWLHIQRSNSENVIYLLCHTSSVEGRQALNSASARVVAYVYGDARSIEAGHMKYTPGL